MAQPCTQPSNADAKAVLIPFLAATALLVVLLAAIAAASLRLNRGKFVYTLDDPYIHMALAKNLVQHGVFGVTRYEFTSATSSPLWTLLIALSYGAVGVREWVPGAWCVAFALLALYAASRLGRFFGLGAWRNALLCLAVAVFTPMAPLASTGMEHTLHTALVLFLLLFVLESLDTPGARRVVWACAIAALAAGVRYESLFVILPLAAVYALHRRLAAGCALGASGCIVPGLYALYSMAHGSLPLPNSLLLKGTFHAAGNLAGLLNALGLHALTQLQATGHLLALVVLVLGAPLVRASARQAARWLPAAFAAATLAHLQFASTGWFYRYEAYLVAAGTALAAGLLLSRKSKVTSPKSQIGNRKSEIGNGTSPFPPSPWSSSSATPWPSAPPAPLPRPRGPAATSTSSNTRWDASSPRHSPPAPAWPSTTSEPSRSWPTCGSSTSSASAASRSSGPSGRDASAPRPSPSCCAPTARSI